MDLFWEVWSQTLDAVFRRVASDNGQTEHDGEVCRGVCTIRSVSSKDTWARPEVLHQDGEAVQMSREAGVHVRQ
eukprot:6786526-Alexandrium_andersonii.AAC.1